MSHTVVGGFAIASLVALVLSLGACGKKGPLYLPAAAAVTPASAPPADLVSH